VIALFPIPQIQIHQQYGILGFKADPATLTIEQPPATIVMHTKQAIEHIQQPNGELKIDQSRLWDALGTGGVLAMNKRVADQMFGIAVDAIAKIVEVGNRMADMTNPNNTIPQIAYDNAFEPLPPIQYVGEASFLNVSEEYTPSPPIINPELGSVNLQVTPNRPVIESQRGQFNAYMVQRNSVEITPPAIDKRL
jgi:hypothetical protein